MSSSVPKILARCCAISHRWYSRDGDVRCLHAHTHGRGVSRSHGQTDESWLCSRLCSTLICAGQGLRAQRSWVVRKAKRVVPVAGDEGVLPQCRVGRTAHRCRRLARNDDDATTRFATTGEERRNVKRAELVQSPKN